MRHQRLTLLWALLILLLCLMPGNSLPQWSWADLFQVDKLVHALLYGILAFLMAIGLRRQQGHGALRSSLWWATLLVCVAYGIGLEVMQGTLLDGRTGDVLDAVANTAGALVGLVYFRREERGAMVVR